jgi:hypothetical protein
MVTRRLDPVAVPDAMTEVPAEGAAGCSVNAIGAITQPITAWS